MKGQLKLTAFQILFERQGQLFCRRNTQTFKPGLYDEYIHNSFNHQFWVIVLYRSIILRLPIGRFITCCLIVYRLQ